MRNIVVTLCLAFAVPSVVPQSETFFSEVMEVRVTNVDVIVTGRDGKPVTRLKRDDFEIYENGVKKEISNFLELRGKAAAVDPALAVETVPAAQDIRRRDITIFIDNSVLHPHRRNTVLPHLQRFVQDNVRGGDTLAVAIWSQSLKLELEATSDRAAIDNAIKRLSSQAGILSTEAMDKEDFHQNIELMIRAYAAREEKPPWSLAIGEARMYAMRRIHLLKQRVEAVKSIVAWRRGVDGRKIMVILTEELPPNPAEEPFLYLDSIRDQFSGANTMAMAEAREFEYPRLVGEITEVANSAGVTLYPINAAGKDAGMVNRAASATPRLNPAGGSEQVSMRLTLQAIAAETGGVAMTGSDNWKLAFDTIANDLETYYSLGYRSDGERQDRMKTIEVRLKNKRHNVRTRRAVIERSITSEMHDAVAANLFRPSTANDLSIKAAAGTAAQKDPQSVVIPLTITIPMDKLTLIAEGGDLTGRFALYAAFVRKDGAVSKVAQQPGVIRFPADSLKRRKELTVKLDVTTDPQTNGISVGVMDELSRATGFASVKLE